MNTVITRRTQQCSPHVLNVKLMAVLQKSAHSHLLLRLIGKNQSVQNSHLRALSQFLSWQTDLGSADYKVREFGAVTSAFPFRIPEQDSDLRQADGTARAVHGVESPHSARSQAGVLLYAVCICACQQLVQSSVCHVQCALLLFNGTP